MSITHFHGHVHRVDSCMASSWLCTNPPLNPYSLTLHAAWAVNARVTQCLPTYYSITQQKNVLFSHNLAFFMPSLRVKTIVVNYFFWNPSKIFTKYLNISTSVFKLTLALL